MRGLITFRRILWLFGLALLIGTVAGAGWMLNHSHGEGVEQQNQEKEGPLPFGGKFIIAFGYVDVLPGITKIYPLVPGQVEWIAEESEFVAKGKALLKLKDKLAKSDLAKAQIALEDAVEVLAEANRLTTKHELAVEAQKAAIEAAMAKKKAAESQVAKVKDLMKKGVGGTQFEVDAAESLVKEAQASITAEQKKLEILQKFGPEDKITRAKLDVKLKNQIVAHAKLGLEEYTVLAPVDGTVLRAFAAIGEALGSNPKLPAIEFCPKLPRIIRTEVQQEYADRIKVGQVAMIEDDTTTGLQWKGKVVRISDWFTHRRSIIQEPFQFNDVRTLECIVEVTSEPPGQKLKIGQRMRVMINQGGP
jgi:multidrug resistance efflux pump